MPRSQPALRTVVATGDVAVVTTAETALATLDGIVTSAPDERVRLRAILEFTTGAGTTAVTLRIRRASLTGALVGEGNPVAAAASANITASLEVLDTPGDVSGLSYVVTIQQTAASGNGNATQTSLSADIPA